MVRWITTATAGTAGGSTTALVAGVAVVTAVALRYAHRWFTQAQVTHAFFRDKHVWVVGASQGIGEALVYRLVKLNVRAVSISARNEDALERVKATASSISSPFAGATDVHVHPLDVSQGIEPIRQVYDKIRAQGGRVDALIVNSGINHGGKDFIHLDDGAIASVVQVNFLGVAFCIRVCLQDMIDMAPEASSRPVVAVVGSLSAYRGLPGGSVYGASKAAVSHLLEALRVEHYKSGVQFTNLAPGFVDTPAIRHLSHPKPFQISSEECANLMLNAIARGDRHYGFPFIMEHVVMRASCILPSFLYEPILGFARVANL